LQKRSVTVAQQNRHRAVDHRGQVELAVLIEVSSGDLGP